MSLDSESNLTPSYYLNSKNLRKLHDSREQRHDSPSREEAAASEQEKNEVVNSEIGKTFNENPKKLPDKAPNHVFSDITFKQVKRTGFSHSSDERNSLIMFVLANINQAVKTKQNAEEKREYEKQVIVETERNVITIKIINDNGTDKSKNNRIITFKKTSSFIVIHFCLLLNFIISLIRVHY